MSYYVERKWVVTDPVHSCQLRQKAGLALDADLALMLRFGAYRLVSMLECGAHRLALTLKCEASQACVCFEMRSSAGSCFDVKT